MKVKIRRGAPWTLRSWDKAPKKVRRRVSPMEGQKPVACPKERHKLGLGPKENQKLGWHQGCKKPGWVPRSSEARETPRKFRCRDVAPMNVRSWDWLPSKVISQGRAAWKVRTWDADPWKVRSQEGAHGKFRSGMGS